MAGPVNPDTILFDAPTKFTDGSPIPVGYIIRYEYGFGQEPRKYTKIVPDEDMTPDKDGRQQAPLSIAGELPFGTWFAAARAVTKDGVTSAWSNEATFETKPKEPEAPANFSVA